MTLKELSQLYHLNKEIESDMQRLEELRLAVSSPSSSGSMSIKWTEKSEIIIHP